ncbi:hypothetical protein ACET3Z_025673 [Daucus carota]
MIKAVLKIFLESVELICGASHPSSIFVLGRKSLKKTKNVDVHDDKVECGHDRDNIKYVEVVDSDDEELVSEEFDESDKMYDDIGSMHESSGNLHDHGEDSVDGDDPIIIPH